MNTANKQPSALLQVIRKLEWLENCSDSEMRDGDTARVCARECVALLTPVLTELDATAANQADIDLNSKFNPDLDH